MSIPVICDRCRQTGIAGGADFSHLGDLLEFEPVPRRPRADGWSPEKQRAFIAALSATGSKRQAALAIGMQPYGIDQMLNSKGSESFKAAYERALAIAAQNGSMKIAQGVADAAARNAQLTPPSRLIALQPGQVLNEYGEPEDRESFSRRAGDAGDRICAKLFRARRLFLMEICGSPGKRAAFEILTELPIDWEKAAEMEAQADEPWRRPNARDPDMVLTAESGWLFGERGYGPDKKAEIRKAIDDWRSEQGLDPVGWEDEPERPERPGVVVPFMPKP